MLYKSFYGHKEFHNAKSCEAYTIEHYGFVIYGKWAICNKLMSYCRAISSVLHASVMFSSIATW
jgi:hypothetical protein